MEKDGDEQVQKLLYITVGRELHRSKELTVALRMEKADQALNSIP